MVSEYPEWLQEIVADIVVEFAPEGPPGVQQMWSYGQADRILDALGFHPEYHDWKRHDKVHADTEIWEAFAQSPERSKRMYDALESLMKLEDELEEDDGNSNKPDTTT